MSPAQARHVRSALLLIALPLAGLAGWGLYLNSAEGAEVARLPENAGKVVAYADAASPKGARLNIYDGQAFCMTPARFARMVYADGSSVDGCFTWNPQEQVLQVAYLNGAVDLVPMEALQKPKET